MKPQRASGGQQVEHRGGQGTTAHAECGNQHERGEQGAGNGSGGIRGIQVPTGLAQLLRVSRKRTNQHGQGAAHQQRRDAHQQKRQHPRHEADMLFQPGKRAGRQTHGERRANTEYRHQHFQPGVQQNGLLQLVRPAPEQQATQRQPGKKRTDPGGDGVHLHADHQ
ncbi:hypothetical protein D3C86_993940 [compost metagenome]